MAKNSSLTSVEDQLIQACVSQIGLYRHGQMNIRMLVSDLSLLAETYRPANPESAAEFETAWQDLLRLADEANPDGAVIDAIDDAVDTFECAIRGL
ncbi:MAG: hypothetical protein ACE5G3_05065 [Gammaproteobacteria bacterium]